MPNIFSFSGFHAPTADMENASAAIINPFLLPIDFDMKPAIAPPIMHPINALDMVKPFTEST